MPDLYIIIIVVNIIIIIINQPKVNRYEKPNT